MTSTSIWVDRIGDVEISTVEHHHPSALHRYETRIVVKGSDVDLWERYDSFGAAYEGHERAVDYYASQPTGVAALWWGSWPARQLVRFMEWLDRVTR